MHFRLLQQERIHWEGVEPGNPLLFQAFDDSQKCSSSEDFNQSTLANTIQQNDEGPIYSFLCRFAKIVWFS